MHRSPPPTHTHIFFKSYRPNGGSSSRDGKGKGKEASAPACTNTAPLLPPLLLSDRRAATRRLCCEWRVRASVVAVRRCIVCALGACAWIDLCALCVCAVMDDRVRVSRSFQSQSKPTASKWIKGLQCLPPSCSASPGRSIAPLGRVHGWVDRPPTSASLRAG